MSDIDIDIVIRLRNSDPNSNVGRRMREAADEIERLKALLTEAADDLEAYINHDHDARNEYPDIMRRWKRDMDLVNRIREALGGDRNNHP